VVKGIRERKGKERELTNGTHAAVKERREQRGAG
jgi:hypothetical protein